MKKTQKIAVFIIILLTTNIAVMFIPEAEAIQTAYFRPPYEGMQMGTHGPYIIAIEPTPLDGVIDREINLETWNVNRLLFTFTWALPNSFIKIAGLYGFENFSNPMQAFFTFPAVNMKISTDRGVTYTEELFFVSLIIKATKNVPGDFTGFTAQYEIPESEYYLFTPETRIMIEYAGPIIGLLPYIYTVVNWVPSTVYETGEPIRPIPPYDLIGEDDEYIQYDAGFIVEYTEEPIPYIGPDNSAEYDGLASTKEKLKLAGDAILNTMHLSGASNEVTDKQWGTDTFIVIYSSQIAMSELIKLRSIIDDPSYLPAVKRFIVWMWSKQDVTDGTYAREGGFPFILTDGDQHEFVNQTAGFYYGHDRIDSFSACAISLMRDYYDATGDIDFINEYWYEIVAAKTFLWNLIDPVYGIPVDGYHFNITSLWTELSTWNWLHDSVEAYKGLKDFAYLTNVTGDPSGAAYIDGWAESIASNIRTYFWNETLGRYSGMFNVAEGTQDTTFVYNVITPLIYGLETNVTRSVLTLNKYITWGILSGRYLDYKWAEDYEITNEYSTMTGMIYAGYAQLMSQFDYLELWMKNSYVELTKFLFNNPVYPNRNLQNATSGILDWVDLVNYRWAPEYARLVETSAWFIDGFIQTSDMGKLFRFSRTELLVLNQSLTAEAAYWDNVTIQFTQETGLNYEDTQAYDYWVTYLKNQSLYIQWYDYQFLDYLYEKGHLDEGWRNDLQDIAEDINDAKDAIEQLQNDSLLYSELDELLVYLDNVTTAVEAAQTLMLENAAEYEKAAFLSYYGNITNKVSILKVRIQIAMMDGSLSPDELDAIEGVKIPLILDLSNLYDWLWDEIIDKGPPWWENTDDPDLPGEDNKDWVQDWIQEKTGGNDGGTGWSSIVDDSETFMLAVGILGAVLMVSTPTVVAWKIRRDGIDSDSVGIIFFGFAAFIIGFGLVAIWIGG